MMIIIIIINNYFNISTVKLTLNYNKNNVKQKIIIIKRGKRIKDVLATKIHINIYKNLKQ